jgi:uncharacterized protein YcbK (DUF882 family)
MKYFKREEFACKCGCGFDDIDEELVDVLDDLREHFGQPVTITSGCRCSKHNKAVGGEPKSKHMEGIAADIKVRNVNPNIVYSWLDNKYPNKYGLGLYKSWVHVDTRRQRARWNKQ